MLEAEIAAVETRLLRYFEPQTGMLYTDLLKSNSRQNVWAAMINVMKSTSIYIMEPFIAMLKSKYAENLEQYSDSYDQCQSFIAQDTTRAYMELFMLLNSQYDFNLGVDEMKNPGLAAIESDVLPNLSHSVKAVYNELKGTGTWSETELGALLMNIKFSNNKDTEEVIRDMKDIIEKLDADEARHAAFKKAVDSIADDTPAVKDEEISDEKVTESINKVHNRFAVGVIDDEDDNNPAQITGTDSTVLAIDSSVSNFEEAGGETTTEIAEEVADEEAVIADDDAITTAESEPSDEEDIPADEEEEIEPYEEDSQTTEYPDSDDAAIENGTLVVEDGTEYPDSDDAAIENGTLVEETGTEYPDDDDTEIENGTLVIEDGDKYPDADDTEIEKGNLVVEDGSEYPDEEDTAIEKEINDIESGRLVIDDDENDAESFELDEDDDESGEDDNEPDDESGDEYPDELDSTIEKETNDIEKGTLVIEDDENDAEEVSESELDTEDDIDVIQDAEDDNAAELEDANDIRSVLKMPKVQAKTTDTAAKDALPADDDDPYDELSFEHENAIPAAPITAESDDIQISVHTKLKLGETINISITCSINGVSMS